MMTMLYPPKLCIHRIIDMFKVFSVLQSGSKRETRKYKPTWPGCPLFPPRFMLPPPPLFMFPLCDGPPLFMGPPLGPMLPLIGPPLGDPPRLGMGPPPRLKFPRLWNPPLKAGGGRKPRGGRLKPPRGPGAAERQVRFNNKYFNITFNISNKMAIITSPNVNRTSSEVASVLEASTATTSLSGSSAANKLVLASPATTTQTAASFWCCASLVGFLLSRQSSLALLLVLFQQLGSLLFLQLSIDDLTEALPLLRQGVEACNGREEKNMMQKEAKREKNLNKKTPRRGFNY